MPKGRAVVLSSGNRPTLIRTQPWMTGSHAERVKASIAAHDLARGLPQAPERYNERGTGPAGRSLSRCTRVDVGGYRTAVATVIGPSARLALAGATRTYDRAG